MKESHIEGVAVHDVPESCGGAREGVAEAFDRGTYGLGIEPRNAQILGADVVNRGGRQHDGQRYRKMPAGPARSETPRTYGIFLRENREICMLLCAMVSRAATGRPLGRSRR